MMTEDQKWGGRPQRAHDLGHLPWNEANKVLRIIAMAKSIQDQTGKHSCNF